MTTLPEITTAIKIRDILMPEPSDHTFQLQDLRLRVLDGEELSAEEMLIVVNDIRKDRRKAAAATKAVGARASKKTTTVAVPISVENLQDILDQEV